MSKQAWLTISAVLGASCVAIGAFAAHALKNHLSEYALSIIDTGVQYQMFHTLAILVLALAWSTSSRTLNIVLGCFLTGTVCFSFSLYLLALSQVKFFAYITPIGGVLLLLAWILLAVFSLRKRDEEKS